MLITVIVKLPNDQLVDVTLVTRGDNVIVHRAARAVGRGPWVAVPCELTTTEAS